MFRIIWTSLLTGVTDHGSAIFTEEAALDVAKYSNEKYPEIHHTIEKYETPVISLNLKGHRCSYGDLTFVACTTPTPKTSQEATPMDSLSPVSYSASQPVQPSTKEQSPQQQ